MICAAFRLNHGHREQETPVVWTRYERRTRPGPGVSRGAVADRGKEITQTGDCSTRVAGSIDLLADQASVCTTRKEQDPATSISLNNKLYRSSWSSSTERGDHGKHRHSARRPRPTACIHGRQLSDAKPAQWQTRREADPCPNSCSASFISHIVHRLRAWSGMFGRQDRSTAG